MSSLEQVWAYREETLYPRLFGRQSRGIFTLDADFFERSFGPQELDPRWFFLGVMEFQPTLERPSWLYVTSGASTPWNLEPAEYDAHGYSWLGMEFVIEVPDQADWPIQLLRRLLASQVLVCHGRFGDMAPLEVGDRLPAGGAIDASDDSPLHFLALGTPSHYEASGQLESGRFDFLQVVGITEDERNFAKATSTEELIAALAANGAYPVTNPKRAGVPL